MKRKFLEELGLEKEQIDSIMSEYGKSVETSKTEISNLKEQIATSNKTIEDIKKANADNETLQKTIGELQGSLKAKDLEIKSNQIKSALEKAGATDIDYSLYKLGNIEEFDINNLDNKVKELKESLPGQFQVENAGPDPKVIENKLTGGEAPGETDSPFKFNFTPVRKTN